MVEAETRQTKDVHALRTFTQDDYNKINSALDEAWEVFKETSENPEEAMKEYVIIHYFPVWRAINK